MCFCEERVKMEMYFERKNIRLGDRNIKVLLGVEKSEL